VAWVPQLLASNAWTTFVVEVTVIVELAVEELQVEIVY